MSVIEIRLPPEVWEDVDEGVEALLDKWLVREGERVEAGQPIANAVIVKTNVEVIAPQAGRLAQILVPEGETFGRERAIARLEVV
ncbi:lipoyl domain-containing protein [Tepidiphilus thermophilus]|uniref:Biotin-requiring enzyme n=1 Tax=Tepidiphilus thermophilus TaxID=876478 RepID=A0A0K6IX49_9PROT|nr:lipoyl domain-containing protein [Tepidiphilus thermophilus]CUB07695.1 Biotin-requiring enzyme [Tepidiphilus thermophilus]